LVLQGIGKGELAGGNAIKNPALKAFIILSVFKIACAAYAENFLSAAGGYRTLPGGVDYMAGLEAEGFAACLSMDRQETGLRIIAFAEPGDYQAEGTGGLILGHERSLKINPSNSVNCGITVFSDSAVYRVIPRVTALELVENTDNQAKYFSSYLSRRIELYSFDLLFSRPISAGFFGGAALRPSFYNEKTDTDEYAYIDYLDRETKKRGLTNLAKADYSVSAGYEFKNMRLALSFGTIRPFVPHKSAGGFTPEWVLFDGYSGEISRNITAETTQWKSEYRSSESVAASGYGLSAGFSSSGKDGFFCATAGLDLGIGASCSLVSSTAVDMFYEPDSFSSREGRYDMISGGLGHRVGLKAGFKQGVFGFGGCFSYKSAAGDYKKDGPLEPAYRSSAQAFDVSAGAALYLEKAVIPFEAGFFAASYSEESAEKGLSANTSRLETRLKTGIEYSLPKDVAAVAGIDICYSGSSSYSSGGGLMDSRMFATTANPAELKTGLIIGLGHSRPGLRASVNMKFYSAALLPQPAVISGYERRDTVIMAEAAVNI